VGDRPVGDRPGGDRNDASGELEERLQRAAADGTPLDVVGGASKSFLGRITQSEPLDVSGHRGVIAYEPTELVITARAGTPLAEVEAVLADSGQMLAFEPPHFGAAATLGGTVAAALSGPRRPYAGAARDFVLGVELMSGEGRTLSFGGQVMKNVAGYDVSRLMVGAMGTLGVLLEISLKVLPVPARTTTLAFTLDAAAAIEQMNAWAGKPVPLSGACHYDDTLYVRLSGTAGGVAQAVERLCRDVVGGTAVEDDARHWQNLREQRLHHFDTDLPLWRLSVPPATPPLTLPGETLMDWGGALRWLCSDAPAEIIRAAAGAAGGHAVLYRNGDRRGEIYHPLTPALLALHQRLKASFDPKGILNRGRMYADL
jgi:glycolate oxidase FAD binding subunit